MSFISLIKSLFSKRKKDQKVIEESKRDDGSLKCPSCNYDQWHEGPGGGSLGNIKCGGCGKWYNNLGPFGLKEITPTYK